MYIYLDESGDLGFNLKSKAPSSHFVITLLVVKGYPNTKSIKAAVKHTLHRKFNYNAPELKSTKTLLPVKKYFYHTLTHRLNEIR